MNISERDRQRIDELVEQFRRDLEMLYERAHCQGGMDALDEAIKSIKEPA